MEKNQLLFIFVSIIYSTVGRERNIRDKYFFYDEQDEWRGQCQSDTLQSPVNIDGMAAALEYEYLFNNYNQELQCKISNDGNTATVTCNRGRNTRNRQWPNTQTTNNKDKYIFSSFDFHWAHDDSTGSEHALAYEIVQLEMHIVHYNEKYKNVESAMTHDDGILIVAALFDNTEKQALSSPVLEKIGLQALPFITRPETSKEISFKFSLQQFLPKSSYFFYKGSLTTPPCSPASWIVFARIQEISKDLMANFRELLNPFDNPIAPNHRKLQNLKGRTLYYKKIIKPN